MMDTITAEEKFYAEKFYFSYSGLNRLLFSPKLWYKHYILQEREEKSESYLVEGKLIHSLLLDKDSFDKKFVVTPAKLPGPDTKTVIDRVFTYAKKNGMLDKSLGDFGDQIVEILKEIDLHQSLKTDSQRINKILTESNISYYEYLKNKEGRDIIDQETLDRCTENAELIRSNESICRLMRLGEMSDDKRTILNEYYIQKELKGYPFGLKGVVDNVVIDHEEQMVYINDIKTSGRTLDDFPDTIDYYNYWLQAAIYKELIDEMCPKYYPVRFTFIVIDKYQQIYPFEVSRVTMLNWNKRLIESLETARWHYENRNFNLPIKFVKETIIL